MPNTNPKRFWNDRYIKVSDHYEKNIKNISGVFVAFNTNLDAIKYINQDFLNTLNIKDFKPENNIHQIDSLDNLKTGLITSMKLGKAMEWEIEDMDTYSYLIHDIDYDMHRIGGQAGIVANCLTRLGMKDVIVFNPKISEAEADMYDPKVKSIKFSKNSVTIQKAKDTYSKDNTPKINIIFEYKKGIQIKTKTETFQVPRMNRFIVSYRPKGREPFFEEDLAKNMEKHLKKTKRAFLSGYHSLDTEQQFFKAKVQLGILRKANPNMKMHLEFTSEEDMDKVSKIVKYIIPGVDSVGCNERETCLILGAIGKKDLAEKIKHSGYSAPELFDGIKYIKEKTHIKRIHIHNINYMLCLVEKSYTSPEKTRDAMLFCVLSAFAKSVLGFIHHAVDIDLSNNVRVNIEGMKQLSRMDSIMHAKVSEGTYDCGKDYLVMIPTKLACHAKATVGLGDVVSSAAFVGDLI